MKNKFHLSAIAFLALTASLTNVCFSQSLDFDGISSYVALPNTTEMPPSYTIEAWVYVTGSNGANNIVSGAISQHAFWAPNLQLSAGHNGAWATVSDPQTLNLNQWYHVAVTYDANAQVMTLYKNGVQVSQATSVAAYTGGNDLSIGSFNGNYLFQGDIDVVSIWYLVLTQAQIQADMHCPPSGPRTGLVADYLFNEGVAGGTNTNVDTLKDASGNNNYGLLTNFALSGSTSNWVSNVPTLYSPPSVTISGDKSGGLSICTGNTDTLTAHASGAGTLTYSWSTGGANDTILVTQSGTYNVLVQDTNGCATEISALVYINNPTINSSTIAAGSTTPCAGIPDTLIAQVSQSFFEQLTYSWNPAGTVSVTGDTNIIVPSGSKLGSNTWNVTVTDMGNCSSSSSIPVQVGEMQTSGSAGVLTVKRNSLCEGVADTLIAQTVTGDIGAPLNSIRYTWSPVNTPSGVSVTGDTNIFVASKPGSGILWKVTISDANGCKLVDTARVTINGPSITIAGDTLITSGTRDVLTASGADDYLWSTNGTHDTIVVAPVSKTTYTVSGSASGCTGTATITVDISIGTGILNVNSVSEGVAYPNPTTNNLNLVFTLQGTTTQEAEMRLVDITGKELMTQTEAINAGKVVSLDVSALPAGIYMIRVENGYSSQVVRFVKE